MNCHAAVTVNGTDLCGPRGRGPTETAEIRVQESALCWLQSYIGNDWKNTYKIGHIFVSKKKTGAARR